MDDFAAAPNYPLDLHHRTFPAFDKRHAQGQTYKTINTRDDTIIDLSSNQTTRTPRTLRLVSLWTASLEQMNPNTKRSVSAVFAVPGLNY